MRSRWQCSFSCALACTIAQSLAAATWDVKVIYDGTVKLTAPTLIPPVSAAFARGGDTVDDDGEPVLTNVRRFSKRPFGVAGAVTWSSSGITLSHLGRLLASGPSAGGTPLLVVDDPQYETTHVYPFVGGALGTPISTSWSLLPGASVNPPTQKYRVEGACVWYGLIVLYAQRSESGVAKGISLFYSQDAGATWTLVPNGHAPPNSKAAGADNGAFRGRQWAAPKPFPTNGLSLDGEFSKTDVYFPWTDYLPDDFQGNPALGEPKGYQVGLFRATRDDESDPTWDVQPNRIIAERWEHAISSAKLHGHTAHTVATGVVVWYGDVSPNSGADFINLDLANYQTSLISVTQHWHGGVAPGNTHSRDSLQPVSAVPGINHGTLMAGDLRYEPVLRLEAGTSCTKPKLTAATYVVSDAVIGTFYEGWETQDMHWYPELGWLAGGNDYRSLEDLGAPGFGDPIRHFSPDGETFATLNGTDLVGQNSQGYLLSRTTALGPTIAALSPIITPPPPATQYRTILLGTTQAVRSLKPLKLEDGADNRLTTAPTQLVAPAAPNEIHRVVWDDTDSRFENAGGGPIANAPTKRAPLLNAQYYMLTTKSLTSGDHGWWTIGAGNNNLRVDQPIYAPIYVASLTPELSLGFKTSIGIGTADNQRTPLRGYKPGCNQGWFACPHFGTATGTPPTNAGQAQMQFLAGTNDPLDPNVGNILVAVGGVYNSAAPVWPTAPDSMGNPGEYEYLLNPPPSTTGWTVAVTLFRPQLSRYMGDPATAGTLFRIVRDATHNVTVKWNPQTLQIDVVSTNGTNTRTFSLPFGHWFRTQPMTIIIADDGMKLEASALSPRFGVTTGVSSDGTMGNAIWPAFMAMYEVIDPPYKVFGLEVGGIAYKTAFLDTNARAASLRDLEFLVP